MRNYPEELSCHKCRERTIPKKLVLKGKIYVNVARCPSCHNAFKYSLPLSEKSQWVPLICQDFFRCYVCGTLNEEKWQLIRTRTLCKTVTQCKRCRVKYAKVVSTDLWGSIYEFNIQQLAQATPDEMLNRIMDVMETSLTSEVEITEKVPIVPPKLVVEVPTPPVIEAPPQRETTLPSEVLEARPTLSKSTEEKVLPPIVKVTAKEIAVPSSDLIIKEAAPPISRPIIKKVPRIIPKPVVKRVSPPVQLKCTRCGSPIENGQKLCRSCREKQQIEFYQRLFLCKKCKSNQIAVQKIKASEITLFQIDIKCPNCQKTAYYYFPLQEINAWFPLIVSSFFRCAVCGTSCKIINSTRGKEGLRVTFYCEIDWMEFKKEIPIALFQAVMTQIQKGS